jgi:putative peptidoglycan lipid II flippase
VSRVLVAAFYAHREVWIPARLSVAPLLLNAVLCVWLAKTALGHAGIALASSLSAVLQVVLLLVVFQRRHRLVDLPAATATLVRSCVAALAMGGACEALLLLFPATSPGRLFLLFEVAFLVVAGAAVYFAASWLLRGSELRELLGPIIRRRRD